MSRTDPQFKLRMPLALRARVEQAAKASLRSLNAELVLRIQQSFEGEGATDASGQLPTPNPRPGLRLLCVLVRKAGHPIAQPVAVSGLPAPWAALSGRWPLALPSPFLLRETRPVPASAEVLARCVRQREAHALRARARSIPTGGLTHAR
ncbi:Arc family DNA-binding protein [Pseudomonas aeruginosa]|nr:Arc family DNA-binding protein [Pseudomonas aeruginosa]RUJ31672.1 Arc family DNA-binding protein [Pseudomonas aeruginosa]